ncbi:MAG: Flp pilus assembly protein CpaB [Reyranellaceae bacterium]
MIRVALLIAAVTAGALAAWLSLVMRADPGPRREVEIAVPVPTPTPAPTRELLVAAADLGRGQALAREHLQWQAWPESTVTALHITRSARPDALEALVGRIARSRAAAGQPILEEMLLPRNTGFLSAALPAGKRAVAVRISPENTAGGFILPNDRVDVINTVATEGRGNGERHHVSRTILKNIPVLAIDQTADEKGRDESNKEDKSRPRATVVGKTATLEVDSQQAEVLAAGEATGSLSLALRSIADMDEKETVERRTPVPTMLVVRGSKTELLSAR